MQSLHRGSFLCTGVARNPLKAATTRRNAQRDPWNFSPYLDVVYHEAL